MFGSINKAAPAKKSILAFYCRWTLYFLTIFWSWVKKCIAYAYYDGKSGSLWANRYQYSMWKKSLSERKTTLKRRSQKQTDEWREKRIEGAMENVPEEMAKLTSKSMHQLIWLRAWTEKSSNKQENILDEFIHTMRIWSQGDELVTYIQ